MNWLSREDEWLILTDILSFFFLSSTKLVVNAIDKTNISMTQTDIDVCTDGAWKKKKKQWRQ